MNIEELINVCRLKTADMAMPPFVEDEEYAVWFSEAEREACERAHLLIDSITSDICEASLSANDPIIILHPKVLFVRRVKLASQTRPIYPIMLADIDMRVADWEDVTCVVGATENYIPDYQTGALRLYPAQTGTDTAKLTVSRLPLDDMEDGSDEPEIHERYHMALCDWALYRAYLKKDADLYSPEKAQEHLDAFERRFGPSPGAAKDQASIERTTGVRNG